MKNGVVCLRGLNDLTVAQFSEYANELGKLLVTERHTLNDARTVQELSNTGLFNNADVPWHNDWSYGRGKYFGTMLYNVHNAHLSPTVFADMGNVPDDLLEQYKDCVGNYYPATQFQDSCFTERQLSLIKKQAISRPFVFSHHVTGQTVLYCSPATLQDCDCDIQPIIDWADANSYVHEWQDGDILIWDNIRMMHKRYQFEGQRLLWRSQFVI